MAMAFKENNEVKHTEAKFHSGSLSARIRVVCAAAGEQRAALAVQSRGPRAVL